MEILLNGTPLDISGLTPDSKLSEVVEVVEKSLKGSGTTIIGIQADDKEFSPEDTDLLEETEAMSFKSVELLTVSANDVIRMGVEDGNEGLTHLEEIANLSSADLRIGDVKNAMDKYLQLVDGIEWFVTMLKNADKAYASAMAESSLEKDRQDLIARLSEQMSGIQKSQENEDWVEMADILEYEFPELFEDGRKLFEKILKAEG